METAFVIALTFVVGTPAVLVSMRVFPKMFPKSADWFVTAMCAAIFAGAARAAQSTLDGWSAWIATGAFAIALSVAVLSAMAGLWDTYAHARNEDNRNSN